MTVASSLFSPLVLVTYAAAATAQQQSASPFTLPGEACEVEDQPIGLLQYHLDVDADEEGARDFLQDMQGEVQKDATLEKIKNMVTNLQNEHQGTASLVYAKRILEDLQDSGSTSLGDIQKVVEALQRELRGHMAHRDLKNLVDVVDGDLRKGAMLALEQRAGLREHADSTRIKLGQVFDWVLWHKALFTTTTTTPWWHRWTPAPSTVTTTTTTSTATTTTSTTTTTTTSTTVHPCESGSHGCDKANGVCVEDDAGWKCECKPGYICTAGCLNHTAHVCTLTTTTTTTTTTTRMRNWLDDALMSKTTTTTTTTKHLFDHWLDHVLNSKQPYRPAVPPTPREPPSPYNPYTSTRAAPVAPRPISTTTAAAVTNPTTATTITATAPEPISTTAAVTDPTTATTTTAAAATSATMSTTLPLPPHVTETTTSITNNTTGTP